MPTISVFCGKRLMPGGPAARNVVIGPGGWRRTYGEHSQSRFAMAKFPARRSVGPVKCRRKMLVAVAVEVHDSRLRLALISSFSATSLYAFVRVNQSAPANTDGWSGYTGAPGIVHDPRGVGPIAAHIVLPWTRMIPITLLITGGIENGRHQTRLSVMDEMRFQVAYIGDPKFYPHDGCLPIGSFPNRSWGSCSGSKCRI